MSSILDRLQQKGQEAQSLEHIAARLSQIEKYQSYLVNEQQRKQKTYCEEWLYSPSLPQYNFHVPFGKLPQFASGSTTYGLEITHATLNTFDVQTIEVFAKNKCYLLLGDRVFFISPTTYQVEITGLHLKLGNGDKRIILTQTASTDVFVGLYGEQGGDAYSVS